MRNRRQWLRKMFFEGARIKKVLCGLCENGWIHVWSAHVSPLLRYDYNKFIVPFADVDECEDGENRCNVNALCSNTLGSYVCRCIRGFEGDGVTCVGRSLRYANLKLQYSSQIVETGAICLEFSPHFLHSLLTPSFSLTFAPLLPQCWARRILKQWDDCNTQINIGEGENHTSVSRFVTSIVAPKRSSFYSPQSHTRRAKT